MRPLVTLLNAAAVLSFGAVYPWGYIPLFGAAALIGAAGLVRHPKLGNRRKLVASLLLLVAAVGLQLLPLASRAMEALSPHSLDILRQYSLTFSYSQSSAHPISIDPADTAIAMAGLAALGLYILGLSATLSQTALRILPRDLMFFAVPLALFGIVSRELNNGLVYWLWKPQQGGGDACGPFVNRNHFAGWMLMACCLSIGWLLGQFEGVSKDAGSDWRKGIVWLSSPQASKLIMTAGALVVMAVSLVWTLSRSAIASFAAALGCFIWLLARRWRVDRVRRAVAIITLGLVLATSLAWRGMDRVVDWFGDTRDIKSRLAAWDDGWRVVRDFPLAGTGLGTYSTAMLFYQKSNRDVHLAQAHNDYLQLVAEGGLLVAVPAAIAIVCLAVAIRRNLGAARGETRGYWIRTGAVIGLVAIAIQEIAEFSLQIPANAFLFCTLAAVALAPVHGNVAVERSRIR